MDDIYVQSFPNLGKRFRITNGGGTNPQWSANGHELFYNTLDNQLMVMQVKATDNEFSDEPAKALFPLQGSSQFRGATYWQPMGDGQRFRVLRSATPPDQGKRINMVINWPALLKP
jgi:hypothetical protein